MRATIKAKELKVPSNANIRNTSFVQELTRYILVNLLTDFLREDGIQCSIEDYGEAILDCFNERSVLFAEMSRNVSIFSKDNCR